MSDFEIRIAKDSSSATLIWASPHPSTYAALCVARAHAARGDVLEVWRDHHCVHREVVGPPVQAPVRASGRKSAPQRTR